MTKPSDATQIFGLPWYRGDTYQAVRAVLQDGHSLPDSYAYWLSSAESVEAALLATGKQVVRIELVPAAFLAWCEEEGLAPNAGARSRYAAAMVARSG